MARITIHHQIQEIERELAMRRRVYPRWVRLGKIRKMDADHRVEVLESILEELHARLGTQAQLDL